MKFCHNGDVPFCDKKSLWGHSLLLRSVPLMTKCHKKERPHLPKFKIWEHSYMSPLYYRSIIILEYMVILQFVLLF